MLRFIRHFLSALLCLLALLNETIFGQDNPRIEIEQVANKVKRFHYLYDAEGTATIPSRYREDHEYSVITYTRSDEGGKIQLQTKGSGSDLEPRQKKLKFEENQTTTKWRLRIWLGDSTYSSPSYTVYSVVIRTFNFEEGKTLINVTHDKYVDFEKEVMDILEQRGFRPLAWTVEEEVEVEVPEQ